MSCTEYSSPPYKLIAFFRDSRDSWEAVAKKRRTEIRDLKARVRDLATSRDLWKGKTKTALGQLEAKEDTLQSLQKELAEAQTLQISLRQECEEFKKKLQSL